MGIIYQPKGKAREYAKYALNHAVGCLNGCVYCYAPAMLRKQKQDYHQSFKLKENYLKLIEKALPKISADEPVLLSFISDPYQKGCEPITREVLKLFVKYNRSFQILTKNSSAARDFDLYRNGDRFAMTLTFADIKDSLYHEPNASLPEDRIEALKQAHANGIKTWVSFEPVIDDKQVYELFERTHEFIDLYKIGKISGFKSRVKDWGAFRETMIDKCKKHNKQFLIKEDLKRS